MEEKRCCGASIALWLSGFFGLGAIVHGVRLVLRIPLVIDNCTVGFGMSALVALVFGVMSLGLLILAWKRPCRSKEGATPQGDTK